MKTEVVPFNKETKINSLIQLQFSKLAISEIHTYRDDSVSPCYQFVDVSNGEVLWPEDLDEESLPALIKSGQLVGMSTTPIGLVAEEEESYVGFLELVPLEVVILLAKRAIQNFFTIPREGHVLFVDELLGFNFGGSSSFNGESTEYDSWFDFIGTVNLFDFTVEKFVWVT